MILGFNADEVFRVAIEIERNGITFYEKGKEALQDEKLKEVFSNLENEEKKHLASFEEMRAELPEAAKKSTDYDPADDIHRKADEEINQYIQDMADMNVFRKPENVDKYIRELRHVEDALRLGIRFEKDSIAFYLMLRDLTEEGKGREFVDDIIAQEGEHLKSLSRELRNEVGSEKLNVFQMPVCASQTAMGAEQSRAVNLDEPCDDSRGGS
ncbi:MAG: ferritin-like domain-containing protein [Thermodesulfobacteriota bacterium]